MILALALASSLAAQVSSDDREVARASVNALASNRAGFGPGRLRFRESRGYAEDFEAAKAGRWSQRWDAEGIHIVDGKRARYELAYPLAAHVESRRPNAQGSWTTLLLSNRYLTDGRAILFDEIYLEVDGRSLRHQTQIAAGDSSYQSNVNPPLGIWMQKNRGFGFERVVNQALHRAAGCELTSVRKLPGDIVEVSCAYPSMLWTMRVDLDRGSVPLRWEERYNKPSKKLYHVSEADDIRQVGGGWLPFRQIHYSTEEKIATEFRILEADFEHRPTDADFKLEYEEPIGIYDQIRGVQYPMQRIYDLAKLPKGGISLTGPAGPPASATSTAPEMPGETTLTPAWVYVSLMLGVALLAGAWFIRRRRRDAS